MNAFINPPPHPNPIVRLGIWLAERITGRVLMPARILAWYPRAAIGSGVLEALVAHREGRLGERMLKLVRLAASFAVNCPFCVDMNAHLYEAAGISEEELQALQGKIPLQQATSLSELEQLAIEYARLVSQTPLKFHPDIVERIKKTFTEKEMVILATTAAQVNYWARLIQALGIPPAGFMDANFISPGGQGDNPSA